MLDSCRAYVPPTNAIMERGPYKPDGILAPIPRTEDGGASPSQYVDIDIFGFDNPSKNILKWNATN